MVLLLAHLIILDNIFQKFLMLNIHLQICAISLLVAMSTFRLEAKTIGCLVFSSKWMDDLLLIAVEPFFCV
jgi:hypothetical protein